MFCPIRALARRRAHARDRTLQQGLRRTGDGGGEQEPGRGSRSTATEHIVSDRLGEGVL